MGNRVFGILKANCLPPEDMILVFSVGGGSAERNISVNIVNALTYARTVGAKILDLVGRHGASPVPWRTSASLCQRSTPTV
jgi:hypothetical protein